jgi:membrane protease YdiL (CAAX protease family)
MKKNDGKGTIILRVILATLLFSVFRKVDSIFHIGNTLADRGWSLLPILSVSALVRFTFAGIVVLLVMPPILRLERWRDWLPGFLRTDRKVIFTGLLSFAGFCTLAAVISLSMGIFKGDLSSVFAIPDIRPDPDVVGWGYFLLALAPGVWEELAFRGLVQSKAQTAYSNTASILLSALFFGLFHFSSLLTQPPAQAIPGVIMAFFFGIGWGVTTVKARSVVPAMMSHYLVDALGQIFLNVDSTDPALTTGFFLLLTLTFPVFNVVLTKIMYKGDYSNEI